MGRTATGTPARLATALVGIAWLVLAGVSLGYVLLEGEAVLPVVVGLAISGLFLVGWLGRRAAWRPHSDDDRA
jgi:hypothetical protein